MKKIAVMLVLSLMLVSCRYDSYESNISSGVSLPEGYEFKRFVFNYGITSEVVYVVFKDGVPVSGTGNNYTQGKSHTVVSSAVVDDTIAKIEAEIKALQATLDELK